ncbi:MAG: CoA transferase [Candidatus Dormibacteraeota bacterium]|nr:CoA transferase [Candidatus Dormibacteraeota bacterium]
MPLEGIRVLDLTHALAGPYCTLVLADLGADVIKVEPPDGDQSRGWGPPFLGEGEQTESSYFLSVNRNKRSVVLDLKSEAGRRAATILALASDVVVENFRPGTASRFGLGPDQLRATKPELVYASISGFGQDWPSLAGYDQIAQGTSGLMSLTGAPGSGPQKVGVPIGDVTAGMFAAHAVLAALVGRQLEGGGRTIDVALNDSLLAMLTYQAGRYFATGEAPGQGGNHHATIAPYGTFATQDGHLNIAVGSDSQFARFCDAIQAPELLRDPRFRTNRDRQARRDELTREIEERLSSAPTQVWRERLGEAGVPAGPIHDLAGAFSDPVAVARGVETTVDHPVAGPIHQVSAPWRYDGRPFTVCRRPPLLGEHTAEVLREVAGYDGAEAEALAATAGAGRVRG